MAKLSGVKHHVQIRDAVQSCFEDGYALDWVQSVVHSEWSEYEGRKRVAANAYAEEIKVYKELRAKQAQRIDVVCEIRNLQTVLVNKGLAKTGSAALRRLDKIMDKEQGIGQQ